MTPQVTGYGIASLRITVSHHYGFTDLLISPIKFPVPSQSHFRKSKPHIADRQTYQRRTIEGSCYYFHKTSHREQSLFFEFTSRSKHLLIILTLKIKMIHTPPSQMMKNMSITSANDIPRGSEKNQRQTLDETIVFLPLGDLQQQWNDREFRFPGVSPDDIIDRSPYIGRGQFPSPKEARGLEQCNPDAFPRGESNPDLRIGFEAEAVDQRDPIATEDVQVPHSLRLPRLDLVSEELQCCAPIKRRTRRCSALLMPDLSPNELRWNLSMRFNRHDK